MTIDELIAELERIKLIFGGTKPVVFESGGCEWPVLSTAFEGSSSGDVIIKIKG